MTDHIQCYRENGVAFPHRVLSEKETADYRREFELIETAFGGQLPYARNLHQHVSWAYDLSMHPKIIDYITPLLGNEIGIIGSQILTKYPHTNDYIAWHQDGMNEIRWNEDNSLSVWLALSDSNAQNGCMKVITGTHKNSKLEHVSSADENNMLQHYSPEIALDIDDSKALNLELKAGEMSVHHQNIIHGSGANHSATKRIGFVLRVINPKYAVNMDVLYLRGEKIYDHTNPVKRPEDLYKKNDPVAYKTFLEKRIIKK